MTSAIWRGLTAGAAVIAVAIAACIEGPTGPGSHPPVAAAVSLTLPPNTPTVWFPTGESLHVAVRRAGRAEPIVDTSLVIAQSLGAGITVPMSQALENFVVTAEVLYSGSLYFLGFEAVRLSAGTDTAIALSATYVGPGARAASYALSLRDSVLRRGDTTSVVPQVRDSAGQPLTNVPARYLSRRPGVVSVAPTGLITAQPVPPDTGRIVGWLPSGLSDSVVVRIRSRADSMALESGGGQSGPRLYPLGSPVVVLVLGDDGAPVAGEPVTFGADAGNGSFAPAMALTDSGGHASSRWTLGAPVGAQAATVNVDGVAPLRVAATAAALPVDSIAVTPAAAALTSLGATQQFAAGALDSLGEAIAGVTFAWSAAPPGVATIDSTGLAMAVAPGTAAITATAAGISGSAQLLISTGVTTFTEDIAFISTRDGNREVYVMNADGSGQRRVTTSAEDEFRPAWAPDRSAVVFERDLDGIRQIFRVDGAGGAATQLTFDGENTRPRVSPDGSRVGFTSTRNGRPEVWVMAADGSNQELLESAAGLLDDAGADYPVGNYFGDWSPDGEQYVFNRYDCPEGCLSTLEVGSLVPGVDTVAPAFSLTGSSADVSYAVRWSPQGWRVALTRIAAGDTSVFSEGAPDRAMPVTGSPFRANAAFAGTWDRFVFESEAAGVHGIYAGAYGGAAARLSPDSVAEFEPDHVPSAQPSWVASVAIAGDTATPINPNESRQLSGVALDPQGTPVSPENDFAWYVHAGWPDQLVASVTPTGLVTGNVGGQARILLSYGQDAAAGTYGDSTTVTVAHPSGTWALADSMVQARSQHAGAVLADGRVLSTGGFLGFCGFGCVTISSATEVYDPTTGSSAASGGMRAFRYEHTATALVDGRVLLVGGRYGDLVRTVQRTAELYDPASGTTAWTDSLGKSDPNSCCTGRRWHTATLLYDGQVLVAGGGGATSGNVSYALSRAELYSPANGTFTATGQMVEARQRHTATRLPDGKVLLSGGIGSSLQWGSQTAELYDPVNETFAGTGSMTVGRREHVAVALADGRVLVMGGYDYSLNAALTSAEIYDPVTGQFTATGSMTVGRYQHAAVLLPDGRVLVSGGATSPSSAEIYDPASGTFSATGSMAMGRTTHVLVVLPSGLVLAMGGITAAGAPMELYRP